MSLRIGFDAVRALRNSAGLGNYSRRVLRGLHRSGAPVGLKLYSPLPPRPAYAGLPDELAGELHLPPAPWRAPVARSLWRSFRLGRTAAADGIVLYHGLTHEIPRDLPATGIPSVVSFLDLLWHRFPGWFPPIDRLSYEWRYRWSARHATAIIAASRQTRSDLVEFYAIDPARIVVLPPPADPRFTEPVPDPVRRAALERLHLPETFLLSVGPLSARKNHRTLLAAFAQLDPARTPPLVLVGRDDGTRAELLRLAHRFRIEDRVQIRSEVADPDLPAVMQSAAAFLYPSLFEGFGLPIVEALSAGVPVIASSGGCFPEAGGPDTLYAPATDPEAFAALIRRVVDDPVLANQMRATGQRYAARFDGTLLAARLLSIYQAVCAGAPLPASDPVS